MGWARRGSFEGHTNIYDKPEWNRSFGRDTCEETDGKYFNGNHDVMECSSAFLGNYRPNYSASRPR